MPEYPLKVTEPSQPESTPAGHRLASAHLAQWDATGAIVVPAEVVAAGLAISVEDLMANMRKGIVYQAAERGTEDDIGRVRLTFRYRNRQFRIVVDQQGRIS